MSAEPPRKRKWDEPAADPSPDSKLARTDEPSNSTPTPVDLDAAKEAAAKIAAQLGGHDPKKAATPDVPYVAGAREVGDPEFVKDIDINDIRNRYLLTKPASQDAVMSETGCSVSTKGVWYPDRSMVKERDPPLYLHITADTQEKLDLGVAAIQKLIDQELGPLIDMRRFERDQPRERRKWIEEKIFLDLEPLRNFNVRAKVVGPAGLFVKYIQQETQTRVQIKGQGSGFIETDTGRETDDPMHINVTGPDQAMVDEGAKMARDLLEVVREEHAKAKAVLEQGYQQQSSQPYGGPPQSFNGMSPGQGWGSRQAHVQQQQQQQQHYGGGGGGGYGQQQQGYGHQQGGYGQQQQYGSYPQGVTAPLPPGDAPPPPPGEAPPPPPPSGPGNQPVPAQQAGGTATPEEWAAYWNSLDAASQAYYTQYYAAAYAAPQTQAPAPPSGAPPPPPPPPPGNAPPEPPRGGAGAYGAVPPPAGL